VIPARVIDLGVCDYLVAWRLQQDLLARRQEDGIPDTLILVEHPHVLTLGRNGCRDNILDPGDMPVIAVERGGDVTYHGPGQLVGYPILQLREGERDVHRYLRQLERAIIATLADFSIPAEQRPERTGVWVGALKIASIGVAIRRLWVTMHGFAINVCPDLQRFSAINPCGLPASQMCSMASVLGRQVSVADVRGPLLRHLGESLGRHWHAA